MNPSQIITLHYWFAKLTPMSLRSQIIFGILFGLVLIAGIAARRIAKDTTKSTLLRSRGRAVGGPLIVLGVLELIFLVLHIEGLPIFSQRIWFALILVVCGIILGRRVRYALKEVPKNIERWERENNFKKYLPH